VNSSQDLRAADRPPDDLADALVRAAGRLGRLGSPVLYFPSVGSTNDVAASVAAAGGAEGTTVVAGHQTAGRGRRGHEWFSPPVSGLYVSVILTPSRAVLDPERAVQLLTMTAGLALAEGIEAQTGLGADIKWPNDLYVGRRKLAGILAEGVPVDAPGRTAALRIVLGYGVNVQTAAYPGVLRNRATSLEAELGRAMDRADLFVGTIAALAARYEDLLAARYDAILEAWRTRARGASGAAVEWDTPAGTRAGVTSGVDRDGALLVSTPSGVERIVSGEVRWACF
jgi:BirA family biotin operon repressor/biotin-[acetyl-CoA-carboxylase] ligase